MNVLTIGTFDTLHPGHLELLAECRLLVGRGNVWVGVNRDEFVERYKGHRPVQTLTHRVEVLRAVRYVDGVFVNVGDEDSGVLIDVVRPDRLAIGDDWLDDGRDETRYLAQLGVTREWMDERRLTVSYIARTRGISSTILRLGLIVIVPSRGRPKRAANMVHSVRQTAAQPVRIVVVVDPDDPFVPDYRRKVRETLVLPERRFYSGALNAVASEVWDDEDILGAFGDDVLFRTPGWDDRVRECLAAPGIAYPNDLAHGAGWPTAVWMSSAIARALGWLAYPGVTHQYVDNVWKVLGDDLGVLRYLPDVVCEHMHVAYGKADWDATYHDVYGERAPADHAAFDAWMAHERERDVMRVRA